MTKKPMNVVVFLGAGFSVPIRIPVMTGYLDALRDSGHLNAVEQDDFDCIFRECAALSSLIGESARNIECIASFLSTLDLTRPDFQFVGCSHYRSPRAALSLLRKAIRFVARPDIDTNSLHRARTFFHHLTRNHNATVTIITTNYDLHAEMACAERPGDKGTPTAPCRLVPSLYDRMQHSGPQPESRSGELYGPSDRSDSPLLIKLHGSVNWYRDKCGIWVDGDLVPVKQLDQIWIPDLDSGSPTNWRLRDPRINLDEPGMLPVLVAPTILKPMVDRELEEQWQAAAKALSEADRLWFIGYSFPPTDSYMRYFLATGLAQNSRLRQIALVDPSRRVLSENASALFADARHQEILSCWPFKWEKLNVNDLIQGDPASAMNDDTTLRNAEKRIRQEAVVDGYSHPNAMAADGEMLGRIRGYRRGLRR